MIIAIVAIARNLAIGKHGKLPWHYSSDLKFFKQTTTGKTVAMGSNTWNSIGKPLPNRLNIVLSRSKEFPGSGAIVLRNKAEIVQLSQYLTDDLFIIGGSQTYAEFADVIDQWIVTEFPVTVEDADTFLPEDFLDGFVICGTIDLDDQLTVKTYERISTDR